MQVFINPKDANNRDITWHNSVALEGYVKRLSIVAVSLPAQAITAVLSHAAVFARSACNMM